MRRKRLQLAIAALVVLLCIPLLWTADSAMTDQYKVLGGCWTETIAIGNGEFLTVEVWADLVEAADPGPVREFFMTRMRHRILFYLIVLCAFIGWSGSIFLRVVRSEEDDATGALKVPTWEGFFSSWFLAGLAGTILFLGLVALRIMTATGQGPCISEGYAYLSAAGGIACGLFVVRFFSWFEERAGDIWEVIFGKFGRRDK